jgi:hypothetical protein
MSAWAGAGKTLALVATRQAGNDFTQDCPCPDVLLDIVRLQNHFFDYEKCDFPPGGATVKIGMRTLFKSHPKDISSNQANYSKSNKHLMKNRILVFGFTCFMFQTYAQTFAPTGSKWVYCYAVNALGGTEGYDTLVVESVAETHFDTLPCQELRVTYCYSQGAFGSGLVSEFTVCQDNKKIYHREGDSLFLLYNFGLMPGDTFRIRYPMVLDTFNQLAVDSSFYPDPSRPYFDVVILDTTTLDLNGQMVWSQTFAEVSNIGSFQPSWYSGRFLEGIGSAAGWLLPRAINAIQEEHIPMGLISYTSPMLNGIFLNPGSFCQTTSLKENIPLFSTRAWPNPSSGAFVVQWDARINTAKVVLSDLAGRSVREWDANGGTLTVQDLHMLPHGMYLLTVQPQGQQPETHKLLIQRP